MPNKYIIEGATFNGDGTSSAAATVAGGVGAWNTISYFEGAAPAYGSIGAGDTVYIRSKTAAGANIVRALVADISLGLAAATGDNPTTWVLDGGTIWAGVSGTLTYEQTNTLHDPTVLASNHVKAEVRGALVFRLMNDVTADGTTPLRIAGIAQNVLVDASVAVHASRAYHPITFVSDQGLLISPIIKVGRQTAYSFVFTGSNLRGTLNIIDADIELTNSVVINGLMGDVGSYPREVTFIGGRVYGIGATSGNPVFGFGSTTSPGVSFAGRFRAIGLEIPRAMNVVKPFSAAGALTTFEVLGADGGIGAHLEANWGFATSRTDNNPPYLSATYPDTAATPWSWRLFPRSASMGRPAELKTIKMFTGTASVKTIRQEFLLATTFALNTQNLWVSITYTDDATGANKTFITRANAPGALQVSDANWSATVWGMISFVKRRIEAITPTAVKSNTLITVCLFCEKSSFSDNDILFVDPDFAVL